MDEELRKNWEAFVDDVNRQLVEAETFAMNEEWTVNIDSIEWLSIEPGVPICSCGCKPPKLSHKDDEHWSTFEVTYEEGMKVELEIDSKGFLSSASIVESKEGE